MTYVRQSEFVGLSLNAYLNKHYKVNKKMCKNDQMYQMWYLIEMNFNQLETWWGEVLPYLLIEMETISREPLILASMLDFALYSLFDPWDGFKTYGHSRSGGNKQILLIVCTFNHVIMGRFSYEFPQIPDGVHFTLKAQNPTFMFTSP